MLTRCSSTGGPAAAAAVTEVSDRSASGLGAGRLSMHMQPVVELVNGRVHRFEALARLVTPHGDVLGPLQFLPALSLEGVDELFRLGLDQVVEHLARWRRLGLATTVSLNISPTTLRDPHCASWVASTLERHGVPASALLLEVLEDEVIDHPDQHRTLEAVRDLGVELVMDDMGAGYSTLARLTALPFAGAKIDRSYVSTMASDPLPALTRLDSLVRLADDFGWDLVVEGIETVAVGEAVAALGVARAQGYLFARPMPAEDVPFFLASFRTPARTGQVTTALGALAHHVHADGTIGSVPLEACPVTAYIAGQQAPASVLELHADLHRDGPPVRRPGPSLLDWLVNRVLTSARG